MKWKKFWNSRSLVLSVQLNNLELGAINIGTFEKKKKEKINDNATKISNSARCKFH